ncbi:MAG: beta-galactosidase [Lachnospiraceae bacterium]|nr:beta-galactosidase [Lachnospiraceae bacterium]
MRQILNKESLRLGTCYYPEHWDKSLWKEDLQRMLSAGIGVIRIAEFAWNKIEPAEGEFTYDFYDEFLDLCEEAGMQVIFCTPTATPPAWLTEKYPEVLNAEIDGTLTHHGARRHYNYNSPVYREKSRIITEKSASHYAGRSCIIGWQLDNEFNCETSDFYSEADHRAFRAYVQKKYGTLDALNSAWGTEFWNQTYNDWAQIHGPRHTVHNTQNPHMMLDYIRFISDSCISFAAEQAQIIRKYAKKDDFVTTNGMFGNLDNHAFCRDVLDFYTYDSYPNFAYTLDGYRAEDFMKDRWWSKNLTLVRSISPAFGIMEQQSGANGWTTGMDAPSPRPGQMRLWTMQSIAHGADFVSYFRWRTACFGTEIYWHGILDYSGRDNERLQMVKDIRADLEKMQEIAGATYDAKVGVVRDYDNVFDATIDIWHRKFEQISDNALFTALQKSHTPFDYVDLKDEGFSTDVSGYKMLFYPHPCIMDEARAAHLRSYVEQGGCLILGCRSGQKDLNGRCVMQDLPGLLADLSGADVKEFTLIPPDEQDTTVLTPNGVLQAKGFADRLSDKGDGEIIGTYDDTYFAGDGAITEHKVGKGKVYYYATAFTEDAVSFFTEREQVKTPYGELLDLPADCELAVRKKDGASYVFILNYAKESRPVTFYKPVFDMLGEKTVSGEVTLPKYGVGIYRVER